eukprot:6180570-Pleurochrysis_carterae.AAC.6
MSTRANCRYGIKTCQGHERGAVKASGGLSLRRGRGGGLPRCPYSGWGDVCARTRRWRLLVWSRPRAEIAIT